MRGSDTCELVFEACEVPEGDDVISVYLCCHWSLDFRECSWHSWQRSICSYVWTWSRAARSKWWSSWVHHKLSARHCIWLARIAWCRQLSTLLLSTSTSGINLTGLLGHSSLCKVCHTLPSVSVCTDSKGLLAKIAGKWHDFEHGCDQLQLNSARYVYEIKREPSICLRCRSSMWPRSDQPSGKQLGSYHKGVSSDSCTLAPLVAGLRRGDFVLYGASHRGSFREHAVSWGEWIYKWLPCGENPTRFETIRNWCGHTGDSEDVDWEGVQRRTCELMSGLYHEQQGPLLTKA